MFITCPKKKGLLTASRNKEIRSVGNIIVKFLCSSPSYWWVLVIYQFEFTDFVFRLFSLCL